MEMKYTCVYFLLLLLSFTRVDCLGHHNVQRDTNSLSEPVPSSGQQRLLVLTVGYSDKTGTYSGAEWKNGMFNEWNNFFKAQSYEKLQYIIDVVTINEAGKPVINDPTAKRYIPLTHNISTYANNEHGWAFGSQWSLHTIVRDASKYLDSKGFSWTPYIQNGKVQNVVIMSAGYDYRYAEATEADAESNYLLSTSYSGVNYMTLDKAVLSSYTFCSEHTQKVKTTPIVMAQLGQCAHEFGHGLGIPDLYDLSFQSTGVGYFDLMAYGMYANGNPDGSKPVPLGAWSKKFVGWISPVEIRNSTTVELAPVSLSPQNVLIVYPDPSNDYFYYLVENKQAIDTWDNNFKTQYGTGVVIWRVNATDANKYTLYNTVNTHTTISYPYSPSTPSVVVMEKDGRQDMSSSNPVLNYGSFRDIWQVGDQMIVDYNFSIAITSFSGLNYTLEISYDGPIIFPDALKSSSPSFSPSFPSVLCLLLLSFVYYYML